MDKQNIVDNWDNYYKSYLELNPDLVMAGINSKRAALNHYMKYGYNEGRQISNIQVVNLKPEPINTIPSYELNSNDSSKIYLEEKMIIEKLDLNV